MASTVALSRSAPSITIDDIKNINTENPALTAGAESFAHNFAYQYFSWAPDRQAVEERRVRLDPYLARDVDRQAGVVTSDLVSSSKLVKSQVWSKKKVADDQAELTLRVQYITTVGKNAVTQLKYFVVPVVAKGENFLVYDIPRFVKPPDPITFEKNDTNQLASESDRELVREVGTFLESFFKIYATGTQEEIKYFSRGEIEGLQRELSFSKIDDINVYAVDKESKKNTYFVKTKVKFIDKDQTVFTYPFEMRIQKEAERWFVVELKN
ncbi:conjugal transfer protein [Paenibacillus alvei]|nr:conjugal transfer protein [Paenibacillus alvei]MCY9757348.1 conjugal transfer protein [Paenibacillus alvei]